MLSQHTSDVNSGRAFASLKSRFASWDEVADAPLGQIVAAILPGGLAQTKAPRIQAILRTIRKDQSAIDLSFLDRLGDAEAEAYLTSLPGIGTKSAACVLTFSMGRAAFPVDTHVHRVTRRLGLAAPNATAERVQRDLTPRVPADLRYEFHVQLIRHGRTICRARFPSCSRCELFDLCEEGPKLLASGLAS